MAEEIEALVGGLETDDVLVSRRRVDQERQSATREHEQHVTGNERSCFLQAEDGIRGLIVTGVQTCALPIYTSDFFFQAEDGIRDLIVTGVQTCDWSSDV